jgi:esterase/lipase
VNVRHVIRLFVLASLLVPLLSAAQDIGVVLMHGKGGRPEGYVAELAAGLRGKGYLVATPAMPWAKGRIYDATFDEAMAQIDAEVQALRGKGARRVVVAGQSLGANAALGYAARGHTDGIIALAPAHNPESPVFSRRLSADVERARALIAAGKGREKQTFAELNQGQIMEVTATPEVYLSWLDPDGAAVMPKSAAAIKAPTPLLFIVGSSERNAPAQSYIFDKAPAHPKSRYLTVGADHFRVPQAALDEVATWLAALR